VEPSSTARLSKRALVDEQTSKATPKPKPSTKGKAKPKNPSPEHVSLDNADTVIEGGPCLGAFARHGSGGHRSVIHLGSHVSQNQRDVGHPCPYVLVVTFPPFENREGWGSQQKQIPRHALAAAWLRAARNDNEMERFDLPSCAWRVAQVSPPLRDMGTVVIDH
jgi:hypothetical protein